MSRTAYPRPELVRGDWTNLNGEWEFEFDYQDTGKERNVISKERYETKINVPFCPESKLSGIGHKDFIGACWYKKVFSPDELSGDRLILNFEAAYYYTEVFVNGKPVGEHKGGYTPFSFDITDFLISGENTLVVHCSGNSRDRSQPSGKQCYRYDSYGCFYTRTTGIWQTVWLERVPTSALSHIKLIPDIDNSALYACVTLTGSGKKAVTLEASLKGEKVGASSAVTTGNYVYMKLPIEKLSLWSIEAPVLYDLSVKISGGNREDCVSTYFGMRKIELAKDCLKINGKPVFMRLVLDQGFYPDGVYTAPDDGSFEKDIKLSQRVGFNGARLHEKVFERRFLYEADKMGYIVWSEYPNWGFDHTSDKALELYLTEWTESMERDFNHPSVIGWCPLNETWDINGKPQNDSFVRELYLATKRADNTRPVIDTSGNYHVETDIYDIHDYCQDVCAYHRRYDSLGENEIFENRKERQKYGGQPYLISEYGGIRWSDSNGSWGYGEAPKTIEEFTERYTGLTSVLINNKRVCGLCYTQLYDVEQECNGIYNYDRTPKFDEKTLDKFRDAMISKAAIEK